MKPTNLLIVTGPMRSGTTLMSDLLHGGGELYRHPELSFSNDHIIFLREITNKTIHECGYTNSLMNAFLPESFIIKWTYNANERWNDFINTVLLDAKSPTPRIFGVKNTNLLPELFALDAMLPKRTKFIVMIRDPRDCVASALARYEKTHGSDTEERRAALAFMNASFLFDYCLLPFPTDQLKLVRYEDLAQDPEKTIRDVLTFCELDPMRYDFSSIKNGRVMSNSSFDGSGPDEKRKDAGIKLSAGHSLPEKYLHATELLFSRLMRQFKYKPRTTKLYSPHWHWLFHDLIPAIQREAKTLGYSTRGLDRNAERSFTPYVASAMLLAGHKWPNLLQRTLRGGN